EPPDAGTRDAGTPGRGQDEPAGRARAPPLAGPRSGPLPGAGARGGPRGDPRAASARLGRGLPVPRSGGPVHHDRRPARPGPGDAAGAGAPRGRRSAAAPAPRRSPARADPDRGPGSVLRRRTCQAAAWQVLLEPEWPALRAILERDV